MSRSRKKVACIRDDVGAMRTLHAAAKLLREQRLPSMSALEFIEASGGCGTAPVFEQAVREVEEFIRGTNAALDKWRLIGPFMRTGMALQGISAEKLRTLHLVLRDAAALLRGSPRRVTERSHARHSSG